MENSRSRNKYYRSLSNDLDYDNLSSDYYTIQSHNKSTKYNHYLSSAQSNYFTKTLSNNLLKKKPKLNLKHVLNYHKNYLHQRIKSNKQFQHLFIEKNISLTNKALSPVSTFYSKSTQLNTTINPESKKIKKYNEKSRNNNFSYSNKIFSKTQNIFPLVRAEKFIEFKEKINEEIKGKYILYQKKDFCDNLHKKLQNKIEQYEQNIRMISITDKLYKSYIKTYDNYEKKIYNILTREIDINETYKILITKIKNDISRIKLKIKKLTNQLKENFQNKCFLMSVKNSTRLVEKFSEQDLEELKYDNLVMSYHLNENNNNNTNNNNNENKKKNNSSKQNNKNILCQRRQSCTTKTKKSFRRTSTILSYLTSPKKNPGRKLSIFSMGKLIDSEKPKHKNSILFNDPQDFINHLDSISINISQLLIKYNNIRSEINILKHELYNVKHDKKLKIFLKVINEEINIAEKKNCENQVSNESLNNIYHNLNLLNNKAENSLNKVQKKIYEIFININSFLKIHYDESKLSDLYILTIIEKCINYLINKVNEDKRNNPKYYKSTIKENDKRKKEEQLKILKKKQKEELAQKINLVIEKSNKIIIKTRRKIENNNYLYNLISQKKNKKPINKDHTKEFFEY